MIDRQDCIEELMAALSRLACGRADAYYVEDDNGATIIHWQVVDRDGSLFLGLAPVITMFSDGTLGWTLRKREFRFSLADLSMLDPDAPDLSQRVTWQILDLADCLRGSSCNSQALVAALNLHTEMRPRACALSAKVAYPAERYCNLLDVAHLAWRYRLETGSARLAPPYEKHEYQKAAEFVATAPARKIIDEIQRSSVHRRFPMYKADPSGCSLYLFS